MSPRRLVGLTLVLLIAGYAWGADPAPSGAQAEGHPVEADLHGRRLTGRLARDTVPVAAAYGQLSLNVEKLHTLDITPTDEKPGLDAVVTLTDETRLSGGIDPATTFPITTPDGRTENVPAGEVEQIRFLHPADTSLLALLLGLLTLTAMEVVLGVDNVVFLALQTANLPPEQQRSARVIGLGGALGMRILLLLTLSFLLGLTKPVFTLPVLPFLQTLEARAVSWRDLIMLAGGAFLIAKSVHEMHKKLETHGDPDTKPRHANYWTTIATIMVIDIVFSLDSVITAIGMVDNVTVMIAAMTIAMGVMLAFAKSISDFVESRPTVKILALSFMILIGVLLVAEGLGQHMNKGYIYFAMAFAVVVEVINMQLRKPAAVAAGAA